MKILVVDDDVMVARVVEATLRSLGHSVITVEDGESALQIVRHMGLRIVVSDWRMPGMSGLDLCRKLRDEGSDYVYFILLTSAEATDENHEAAVAAGVDDFLTKPVKMRELRHRLHVAGRLLDFATKVAQLEKFIPICSYCKKVRDDQDYWQAIEQYVGQRTGSNFSHGVCPECYEKWLRPQLDRIAAADGEAADGA